VAALSSYEFEVIVPGNLTFGEQVEAFASAEIVVGPHGAALTNLLFCAPGTLAIELHHSEMDLPWFAQIAYAGGLLYERLACEHAPAEPDDMIVEVNAIISRVATFLEQRASQ
jgi:capsular polysaccharide biosynthesis protein